MLKLFIFTPKQLLLLKNIKIGTYYKHGRALRTDIKSNESCNSSDSLGNGTDSPVLGWLKLYDSLRHVGKMQRNTWEGYAVQSSVVDVR